MSNNPDASVNLRLVLEKAGLVESRKAVADLTKQLVEAKKAAAEAGNAEDESVKRLTANLEQAVQKNAELEKAFSKTAAEAKQLGKETSVGLSNIKQLGGALSQLGLGSTISQLGAAGEVLGNLGTTTDAAQTAIAEAGGAMELLKGAFTTANVTIALAVAAIGGLIAIFKELEARANASAEAEKRNYEEQLKQADLEVEARHAAATKTAEQNKADIDALAKDIDTYGALLAKKRDQRAANEQAYADLGSSFNPGERSRLGAEGKQLDAEIADLRSKLDGMNDQFHQLSVTLPPMIEEEKNRTDALERQKQAQEDAIAAADKAAQRQIENAALIRNGSSEAVKETLAHISQQVKAYSDEILDLQMGDKSDASTKRIEELKEQIRELSSSSYDLSKNILPLIQAREAEKKATEAAKKAIEDKAKQDEALAKVYENNRDATARITQQGAEQRAQIEEDYQEKVASIEADGIQARIKINEDYSDRLIEIAQNAKDQAEQALANLQQTFAQNELSFQRGEADASAKQRQSELQLQIEAQRAEAQNLTEHLRNLEDIRNRSRAGDTKFLLDRNFLGLLQSRQGEAQSIQDENTRFARQGQDQSVSNQQRLAEIRQQAEIERQERLQAFQRQQADAQAAYERQLAQFRANEEKQLAAAQAAKDQALQVQAVAEDKALQQAQAANTKAITALQSKLNKEFQIQQQAYIAQLKLVQQSEQEKLRIMQAAAMQARSAYQQSQSSYSSPSPSYTGSGIGFGAAFGAEIKVNEFSALGQRESYLGQKLPAGIGYFRPLRSGTVEPNLQEMQAPTTHNNTFYITSHDPAGVQREVVNILKQVIR